MNPPKDVEPLRWRLYTSEPAQTLAQAPQTAENLRRMAQIRAFVAVRLLQLKQHATSAPERPCEPLLDATTWTCLWLRVEKQSLPEVPPTQRWALHAVAWMGGWNDSKRTGRPGWVALMRGWQELQARTAGYRLALAGPV